MLQSSDADGEESPDFKWGEMKGLGQKDKNVKFYESFTFDGIEYRLFDCAYFCVRGQCETSIGKLVKMFETSTGEKKVKVIWFFRPIDIRSFLGKYEPLWDELFLACGDDLGVSNINDVEAILGKCNVVCQSRHPKNRYPSKDERRMANYLFTCTFDTRLKIISKDFADAIAGIGVEKLFNKKREEQPLKRLNSTAAGSSRPSPVKPFHPDSGSTKLGKKINRDRTSPTRLTLTFILQDLFLKDSASREHLKKNPPVNTDVTSGCPRTKSRASGDLLAPGSSVNPTPSKKRKLRLSMTEPADSYGLVHQPEEKRFIKNPPLVVKAPSQNIPFEDELKEAIEKDRLLLFENLEPSYTSLDVEDLCWQAFNERVDARMIPASLLSSPHNGKALVIFGTTRAADKALSRLTEGYLMLSDERPLVASRNAPKEVGECKRFTGHFTLVDKAQMSIQKASYCNSHVKRLSLPQRSQKSYITCDLTQSLFF
ncbi:unnamed protein product [Microthlaspi erraticum]|uniref:BAH domain-containing protein n=1 Tax=Microthlaspi erraticum TaxID=1685480 RepID=A0A6D2L2P5_9BRAS|nr:unnamed protein product [Microthlaspi erraticum]CAA7051416.1 unnamed protein product [Microthlaspi erraticum]CAA7054259.1 unnamed protein product [Microthlaspi erraticum]